MVSEFRFKNSRILHLEKLVVVNKQKFNVSVPRFLTAYSTSPATCSAKTTTSWRSTKSARPIPASLRSSSTARNSRRRTSASSCSISMLTTTQPARVRWRWILEKCTQIYSTLKNDRKIPNFKYDNDFQTPRSTRRKRSCLCRARCSRIRWAASSARQAFRQSPSTVTGCRDRGTRLSRTFAEERRRYAWMDGGGLIEEAQRVNCRCWSRLQWPSVD